MSGEALYLVALSAAFWAALLGARPALAPADATRCVAGLALAGLFARAGGLLYAPAGLLLAAPWSAPARARFLDAALPALPLAFGIAKLGCMAAGCCAAAGLEALGFAAVHVAVGIGPPRAHSALALAGIGFLRLAALPLRPEARGSAWLAVVWLAFAALRCRPSRGEAPCRHPGNASSRRMAPSSRAGCGAGSARAISR